MPSAQRSEVTLKLAVVLARANSAVAAHAEAHAAKHGLTLQEFAILEALHHKGDMLLGELQKKILVTSGGVTYLVDRLTEKGLVKRKECESDRRARYATLTPKGTKLITSIFDEHIEWLDRAIGGLDLRERQEAVGLLRKLGHHAAQVAAGS